MEIIKILGTLLLSLLVFLLLPVLGRHSRPSCPHIRFSVGFYAGCPWWHNPPFYLGLGPALRVNSNKDIWNSLKYYFIGIGINRDATEMEPFFWVLLRINLQSKWWDETINITITIFQLTVKNFLHSFFTMIENVRSNLRKYSITFSPDFKRYKPISTDISSELVSSYNGHEMEGMGERAEESFSNPCFDQVFVFPHGILSHNSFTFYTFLHARVFSHTFHTTVNMIAKRGSRGMMSLFRAVLRMKLRLGLKG